MEQQALIFSAPRHVQVRPEPLAPMAADQVRVKAALSAISQGSELLVYRGEVPPGLQIDESIATLPGSFRYPFKYGYAVVGSVVDQGEAVPTDWVGKTVFAFHPHQNLIVIHPDQLLEVPAGIPAEDAVFLPNMETAVNLLMDGRPVIGEKVVVFGQGVVGLLTSALLLQIPLARIITLDRFANRREASIALGVHASLDPATEDFQDHVRLQLGDLGPPAAADLVYELSGDPAVLEDAIAVSGFEARIVVGSWYGTRRALVDLGGDFHRRRIRIISSQVSTLASHYRGRWSKDRRIQVAWEMIRRIRPSHFITQRLPFADAARAYELLDRSPDQAIQLVLTYGNR